MNKLMNILISNEQERIVPIKQLLDATDHILLKWTQEIATFLEIKATKGILESYFQQVLLATINKALFSKRLGHVPNSIEILEGTADLYEEMKNSKHPETLNICARFAITLGLMHLEFNSVNNALNILLEGIKCLAREQQIRLKAVSYLADERFDTKQSYKIRRNLLFIMVATFNIGLAYTMNGQNVEALESFRMCKWYYQADRGIFEKRPVTNAYKFILEMSRDEESRILAEIEAEKDNKKKVEAPKRKTTLKQDEVTGYIDKLWSKTVDSKDLNKQIRHKNFEQIVNSVKSDIGTHKIASNFGKYKSMFEKPNSLNSHRSIQNATVQLPQTQSTNLFKLENSSASNMGKTKYNVQPSSNKKRPATARTKINSSHSSAADDDKKMLNPDEYFKMKICEDMLIDTKWLEEESPRIRFRQDMIEQIMGREKNSRRSLNILKDFLTIKRRDKVIKELKDKDPKALQKEAFYDIGHKMYSLQKEVNDTSHVDSWRKAKMNTQSGFLRKLTSQMSSFGMSPKVRTLYTPMAKPLISIHTDPRISQDQERKKIMTKVAEDLQRDIYYLEKTVQKSKVLDSKLMTTTKKKEIVSEEIVDIEHKKHQNLANSVVIRAKQQNALLENQAKRKPANFNRKSQFVKPLKK